VTLARNNNNAYGHSVKNDIALVVEPSVPRTDTPYTRANVRSVLVHYLCGRLLSGAAGILFVVLLVRHMATPDYARFATMSGAAATLGMLSSLGLEKAVTRFVPEGRLCQSGAALSRFIWLLVGLRLAALFTVTVALIVAWPYLFAGTPTVTTGFLLPLAALIISINLFQFLALILQALVQQKTLTRVLVIQWGGRLLLLVTLLFAGLRLDLKQALYIVAVPDAIGSVVLGAAIWHYLRLLRGTDTGAEALPRAPWPAWPEIWKTSRHNYGYAWLITPPQGNAMIVIASFAVAAPLIAAYGFFISIVERIRTYLPLMFLLNLAEPILIAGYIRDRDFQELCRRSHMLYKLNLILLMLLLGWCAAVAPAITNLLTGGKYGAYAFLLPLLFVQVALGSHNMILQIIANSVGRSDILSKSGAVALGAMMLALLLCLKAGAPLLLFATPLIFEIANIAVTVVLLRRYGFNYSMLAWFHFALALACGAAYFAGREAASAVDHVVLQLGAAGAAATFAFLVVGYALRVVTPTDVFAVKQLLRPRAKA
jgi:O-antigen/teichoic acid export membrane protein